MRSEVLIVGGGIAGSTLAHLLASKGFNVVLVERKSRPGHPHHCSGILGFDAIKELALFSEDWVLSEVNWAKFISPGGFALEIKKPLAKVVDRSRMDSETWELAISSGAIGMLSTPFKGLISRKEAVIKGGTVSFDLIVGADGTLSSVARAHGLSELGVELGLQRICGKALSDGYIVRILRGSKFSWLQPWGELNKVGAVGEVGEPLARMISGSCPEPAGRLEGGLIPKEVRGSFWGEGFALLGNAAGQVKPVSRGGVLLSVRAAKLLAEELSRGWEDIDRALANYERRWWKMNGNEVILGWAIRRYLDRLTWEQLDYIFKSLKEHEEIIAEGFETDRQASPLKMLPKTKVLKLLLSDPRASAAAMSEALKYLMRW